MMYGSTRDNQQLIITFNGHLAEDSTWAYRIYPGRLVLVSTSTYQSMDVYTCILCYIVLYCTTTTESNVRSRPGMDLYQGLLHTYLGNYLGRYMGKLWRGSRQIYAHMPIHT